MVQTRADNWTEEQDTLLVHTVIQYIANNKTQLQAFEEVGEKLNRTSAAVGFRFNSTLRHKYKEEVEEAKQIRLTNRQKKRKLPAASVVEVVKEQPKEPVSVVKEIVPKVDYPTMDLSIYDSVGIILKKFGVLEKAYKEAMQENTELRRRLMDDTITK